jgi:hypothetical protein
LPRTKAPILRRLEPEFKNCARTRFSAGPVQRNQGSRLSPRNERRSRVCSRRIAGKPALAHPLLVKFVDMDEDFAEEDFVKLVEELASVWGDLQSVTAERLAALREGMSK